MCNTSRVIVAAAAALYLAVPAQAQTHEELQARAAQHRARIDSLLPLYREAAVAQKRAEERATAEQLKKFGKLDTVQAGPFRLVGLTRDVENAAPFFERAGREYEPVLGDVAARVRASVFVIRGDEGEARLRPLYDEPRHYLLDLPSIVRYRDRMRVVRAAVGKPLREQMPAAVQQWIGDGNFGAGLEMDRAYRELAIGMSRGAEQCHAGDIRTCVGILGLSSDTAWLTYYSPQQRRELVRSKGTGSWTHRERCITFKVDAACDAALMLPDGRTTAPAPLSYHARVVLLEHALRRGGTGSFDRLVADSSADVRTALAAAAGTDMDALVASWRAELLAQRPNAAAGLGSSLLVTLFWTALLITLANRSTRWRIG